MTPEFSRIVDAGTISEAPRQVEIGADETERRRLAGRFRLKAIDRLSGRMSLSRRAGTIYVEGEVNAAVVQSCVVTDEPMPATIVAPFAVRFVPDALGRSDEEEIELTADDCDTLPLEHGRIDLGEIVAETLVLALDPYPRSENADAALHETGLADAPENAAFAGLKALKDRMEKDS